MKSIQQALILSSVLALTACSTNTIATDTKNEETEAPVTVETHNVWSYAENYVSKVDQQFAYDVAHTLSYDPAYLSNALGFRTSGSDAEHAAADYIASTMEEIGLQVEKIPVTVDLWQFNDASLTIDGTDISIMPASYATNGTDKDGITAQIVDVQTGTAADYEDVDVEGKIALVGVDQWNVAWIDQYMNEAANHGAAAIVSYDIGGYATYSDDMINMQDLCAEDVIPNVSISYNQYKQIAKAIENGNDTATLIVDNVMKENEGTSYNVVGTLKGKSSDQQIIVSGHYDVYFNGFQDDSCAIGLVLAMAKGMVDSGYTPENDILFIAHGSEEWGAIGSQFDWTTGAWEMINNAKPEWAGKTIAMINFELPAFYDGMDVSQISCVPEYAALVNNLVSNTELFPAPVNNIYKNGISNESVDTNTMEDGVSYRASGVPYFINIPGTQDGEEGWIQQHYHTVSDDETTYSADVMATNLNTYGSLAIYLDQMPAIALDFTATCDDLAEVMDESMEIDDGAYMLELSNLREAAEKWNDVIADVNTRYTNALANSASQEELDAIREEGKVVNKKSLEAFRFVQDHFIGIISTSDVVIKHSAYLNNVELLDAIIGALEDGELSNDTETGALDLAWMLNGSTEFGYYNFSVETNSASKKTLLEENNPGNVFWGTSKGSKLAQTYPATISLLAKAEEENPSFEEEIAIYQDAFDAQFELLEETVTAETEAMIKLTQFLSD